MNEELAKKKKANKLHCTEDVIRLIPYVGPVARTGEERNAHRHLIGKP
jgi:hypothetical protein